MPNATLIVSHCSSFLTPWGPENLTCQTSALDENVLAGWLFHAFRTLPFVTHLLICYFELSLFSTDHIDLNIRFIAGSASGRRNLEGSFINIAINFHYEE